MKNSYCEIDTNLEKLLHGVARLHVALARMDNRNITTRGWTYNQLVDSIIAINSPSEDYSVTLNRCMDTLFDTLEAMEEIGKNAVLYLEALSRIR